MVVIIPEKRPARETRALGPPAPGWKTQPSSKDEATPLRNDLGTWYPIPMTDPWDWYVYLATKSTIHGSVHIPFIPWIRHGMFWNLCLLLVSLKNLFLGWVFCFTSFRYNHFFWSNPHLKIVISRSRCPPAPWRIGIGGGEPGHVFKIHIYIYIFEKLQEVSFIKWREHEIHESWRVLGCWFFR